MNTLDIKTYLFNCCKLLKMKIEEREEEVYRIFIPNKYDQFFNFEEHVDFTFSNEKSDRYLLLNEESFLLQKIATLVSKERRAYQSGTKKTSGAEKETLYFWYKITIRGNMIEEEIKVYSYDLHTKEISLFDGKYEELIVDLKETKEKVEESLFDNIEDEILDLVKKEAKEIARGIQEKQRDVMETEIDRINEYFELVKKEHQSSYTHTSYEDFGIINKEKDNLIEQQREKYTITSDHILIRPIAVLYTKEKQEL